MTKEFYFYEIFLRDLELEPNIVRPRPTKRSIDLVKGFLTLSGLPLKKCEKIILEQRMVEHTTSKELSLR